MHRLLCALLIVFLTLTTTRAQWSEPVLVDTPDDSVGVNTRARDWCPFVTADGQLMYFASERDDPSATDVYVSRWGDSGWGPALRLPFCLPHVDERNPSVNATNDTLYFIRFGGPGGWDIWWSFRGGACDTCWGIPQPLPEPINSTAIEFSVWCTPDNGRLLLSSDRPGSQWTDLYQCRRDPATPSGWSAPQSLPGRINNFLEQHYPSMGWDTTEIFFRHNWDDLKVSRWGDSGWAEPERLPAYINHDMAESTPAITANGGRLYFASAWSTPGNINIWYTERPLRTAESPPLGTARQLRMHIYPNPATEWLNIRTSLPVSRIVICNVLGQTLYRSDQTSARWISIGGARLSITSLPTGNYFVMAQSPQGSAKERLQIIR